MINLNDYYLHPLDSKYLRPGMKILHYDIFSGIPVPVIAEVTKVKKLFGSVISYEYKFEDGGYGTTSGGIDVVIQVVPMLEKEMAIWGVRTEEELEKHKKEYKEAVEK